MRNNQGRGSLAERTQCPARGAAARTDYDMRVETLCRQYRANLCL
jgi:hypothetical protein